MFFSQLDRYTNWYPRRRRFLQPASCREREAQTPPAPAPPPVLSSAPAPPSAHASSAVTAQASASAPPPVPASAHPPAPTPAPVRVPTPAPALAFPPAPVRVRVPVHVPTPASPLGCVSVLESAPASAPVLTAASRSPPAPASPEALASWRRLCLYYGSVGRREPDESPSCRASIEAWRASQMSVSWGTWVGSSPSYSIVVECVKILKDIIYNKNFNFFIFDLLNLKKLGWSLNFFIFDLLNLKKLGWSLNFFIFIYTKN